MNPSRIFILRPVATTMLMVGILLAGAVGYTQLPVSALPEVDYPIIQVITFYPGASPDVMASSVTAPLERQFGQVPGLQQMTSTSSDGSSVITLQFNLSLSIDVAEQEVQQSINASGTYLPADLPAPPIYSKTNPADTPILTLALTSTELPLSKVEDLADTRLAPKMSQLPGVGLVSISGGQKPAVRIQANPTAMASYGLNLEDLRTAIVAANVNQAKGNFDGAHQAYQIGANDQLLSSSDYAPLIIAYKNGAPVKLTDVATVLDDTENVRQAAWMNQTPAVILNIQRQPGANIISVVDRIKQLLPQLTSSLPASIHVSILTDRTTTIRASVSDVQFELMLTVALVVMVMFLFLRNIAATIIPGIAVPLSLVATFGVMYLLGYSLNNLTLMALTISTGFVVDDAIVMIENITRYIEAGETPLDAALKGSAQIGFTIVSLTVSLIAVLIPLLFMGDIVGRLFREFAVTLSVTILASAVVSLTLTPMMCSKLLKHTPGGEPGTLLPRLGARLQCGHRLLRQDAEVGAGLAGRDAAGRGRDSRPDHLPVLRNSQRILPHSRYRRHPGRLRSGPVGVLSGNVQPAAAVDQDHSARSGRRQSVLLHRNRRDQYHLEQRAHSDQLETDRRAKDQRQRRHSPPAAGTGEGAGHHAVHAAGAGSLGRRPGEPHAIPVHAGRSERGRVEYLRAADARQAAEAAAIERRGKRSAGPWSAGQAGVRSQHRRRASGSPHRRSTRRLYDAYGQREVSTMFTQLNQYHVVLEVKPGFDKNPSDLSDLFIQTARRSSIRRSFDSILHRRFRMAARSRSTPSLMWRRPPFPSR